MNQQPKKRTILLIEDNDDHAEISQFYIEEYAKDINVVRLSDGKLAIDHLLAVNKKHNVPYPWLILLDIKLPKYDGHEVLQWLKAELLLTEVPVVIFTSSNSNKDIENAFKEGANSYIQKPMEPDGFSTVISRIIDYWTLDQHGLIVEGLNRSAYPE